MGKVYTHFQTNTAQKPYPLGRHIPLWLTWRIIPRMAVAASDLKCSRRNTKMDWRKSPTRQQTNAPKFIKRKTCSIYTLSSLKSQSDTSRWHFCNPFQSTLSLNAFEISNTLTSSKTAHSLSPPQRPLCIVGRLEKGNRKRGGTMGRGKRRSEVFPSSHRPLRAFYFSVIAIFIRIPSGSLCGEERFILSRKSFKFCL